MTEPTNTPMPESEEDGASFEHESLADDSAAGAYFEVTEEFVETIPPHAAQEDSDSSATGAPGLRSSAPVVFPKDAGPAKAWDRDWSPQRIASELQHIEDEVRAILEGRDPKRKRKFTGTRRWLELEEDLIAMQFTDKLDTQTFTRVKQLVQRRHSLFKQLRFLAGTRPTWNT